MTVTYRAQCQNYRSSINLFSVGHRRRFAELFEGGFKVFDPSTRFTAWPWTLARGRPERNESRDDDLLSEHIGIGKIVGLFEALAPSQKMSRLASSFYCEKTPRARNMKST